MVPIRTLTCPFVSGSRKIQEDDVANLASSSWRSTTQANLSFTSAVVFSVARSHGRIFPSQRGGPRTDGQAGLESSLRPDPIPFTWRHCILSSHPVFHAAFPSQGGGSKSLHREMGAGHDYHCPQFGSKGSIVWFLPVERSVPSVVLCRVINSSD